MENFISTPDGLLLIANGVDKTLRWNSFRSQAEPAGVLAPTTALTLAGSGAGDITGTYIAYSRFVDYEGNPSNLSPVSTEVEVEDVLTINYTSVPVPTEDKVVRRQIWRNTDGQQTTLYLDIDTTDLTSTALASTNTDTELQSNTELPILNSDGTLNANRYTPPPSHKSAMAHLLGRMFYAVDGEYADGHVEVTFGSTTVYGIGTDWKSTMAGWFLWVNGASQPYEIDSVDESAQTITLEEAYQDATDLFAPYSTRPAIAERRLVYWSESGLPEAVPAINAAAIQETGDELSGLMAMGSYLFVLEQRHIHRWTFQLNPATDGAIFKAADRGCVNQRSWVLVDDKAYMLDEGGIHAFDGQESQPVSLPFDEIFRPGETGYRVNWTARRWFHAVHFPAQSTIIWFVALNSSYLPRQAIVFNYRLNRGWLYEMAVPVGASCLGTLAGRPQVFLGMAAARIGAFWRGGLDGANEDNGTVRGTVTSADQLSLTDSTATFATDVVSTPLAIIDGTGKGQIRLVSARTSATVLAVKDPWLIQPDTTSKYQVGSSAWKYLSGRFEWTPNEQQTTRKVRCIFHPLLAANAAQMDLRVYHDQDVDPLTWRHTELLDGIQTTENSEDLVCSLTKTNGHVQKRMDGNREGNTDGPRHLALELRGFMGQDQVRVRELVVEGAKE